MTYSKAHLHRCVVPGCKEMARGYWCPKHDAERMERIGRRLDDIVRKLGDAKP